MASGDVEIDHTESLQASVCQHSTQLRMDDDSSCLQFGSSTQPSIIESTRYEALYCDKIHEKGIDENAENVKNINECLQNLKEQDIEEVHRIESEEFEQDGRDGASSRKSSLAELRDLDSKETFEVENDVSTCSMDSVVTEQARLRQLESKEMSIASTTKTTVWQQNDFVQEELKFSSVGMSEPAEDMMVATEREYTTLTEPEFFEATLVLENSSGSDEEAGDLDTNEKGNPQLQADENEDVEELGAITEKAGATDLGEPKIAHCRDNGNDDLAEKPTPGRRGGTCEQHGGQRTRETQPGGDRARICIPVGTGTSRDNLTYDRG